MFVFPAALFQNYLASWTWTTDALSVLFGLGAISAAKFPDGVLAENTRRLRHLVLRFRPVPTDVGAAPEGPDVVGPPPSGGGPLVAERVS
jgi:hypothetical protein